MLKYNWFYCNQLLFLFLNLESKTTSLWAGVKEQYLISLNCPKTSQWREPTAGDSCLAAVHPHQGIFARVYMNMHKPLIKFQVIYYIKEDVV